MWGSWLRRGGKDGGDKNFNPETVMTPCRALMDSGYHLREDIDSRSFDKARELELRLIAKMHEINEAANRKAKPDEEPVTYKIGDYPRSRQAVGGNKWADASESILRVRDYTGKPSGDDKLRDELVEAYKSARIPELTMNFRGEREVTDAEELVREIVRSARGYILHVGGDGGRGFHTAG